MKSSFLEYYQLILDKVRFDMDLFQKEYRKAKKFLTKDEQVLLDEWLNKYGWSADRIETQKDSQVIPKQRLPY